MLLECSWEVCNKVGGIYTVLSTKAKTLKEIYGDNLIFVGPDVWEPDHESPVFKPVASLLKEWRRKTLLPGGVTVRVGRWEIPGRPIAVLVGFRGMYDVKNEFYGEMWRNFGVDSLHAYGDYDEGCAFAHAAGFVMKSLYDFYTPASRRVVAHFNEWTTAMGLLYLRLQRPGIATVFTTHATCIGRSICGNNKPLYDYMGGYNGDQMSRELNMEAKHSVEKAAAHVVDCFTTVSDVTARECAQLLEKRPDVVTPNGFERDFVPAERARLNARRRMLDVAAALTGKRYTLDTFMIATSGRPEYRNKGLDMFIDSMTRLSDLKPARKVLAWILVPAWSAGRREDLARALSQKTRTPRQPAIITHQLHNPDTDAIYNRLRSAGIDNLGHTRVDIIYVPTYLDGHDGIIDLPYYDVLASMNATVFPSYYEPWGYTPLESVAMGVPTVTTSLSGFGSWVKANFKPDFIDSGVDVIERTDSNYGECVDNIARDVCALTALNPTRREEIAARARATARAADWSVFISHYEEAYSIALRRAAERND